LNVQTPSIVKSIVGQLTAKSLSTRQAGFALLHELVAVLSGGLESQIPLLVTRIEASLKTTDSGLSGAATQLKIEVLSLLSLFFKTHHPKTYSDELSRLVPLIVSSISDRFNKIAAEAFVTASSLIKALRPVSPNASTLPPALVAHLTSIYQATMERLQGPDADEEVKGKGIQTLGTLLYHAGDYAAGDLSTALSFLRDRLKIEVQRIVAVQTVGFVASSPVLRGSEFDQFVLESLSEVSSLLRKIHRPLKIAAFDAIDALLARAATSGVPDETAEALLQDLEPLLTDHDVNLLPHALNTTAGLLAADPSSSANQIEDTLLPRIYQLVQSPLVQGPSLEGLLRFFQAYLQSGAEPEPLVKQLSATAETNKGKAGEAAGIQHLVTASRCIGMIAKESNSVGATIVKDNEKILKVSRFFVFIDAARS
jgi:cullin-associated NEDD8-dissociated protein 1